MIESIQAVDFETDLQSTQMPYLHHTSWQLGFGTSGQDVDWIVN